MNLTSLYKDIPFFSLALQQLSMSHYHSAANLWLDLLKKNLDEALIKISALSKEFSEIKKWRTEYYAVPSELSDVWNEKLIKPETMSLLTKAWVAIANHHKNFNQRFLMFDALQKAYNIKNKEAIKKQWLDELGVKNFKELVSYFKFVETLANVSMKKMQSLQPSEQTDQRFKTMIFNLQIEMNNISMLQQNFINKLSFAQAKELNGISKNIQSQYAILERDVHRRQEDNSEKSGISFKLK